jgi:hypothetical protein
MGLWSWLTGSRKADPSRPVRPVAQLKTALLELDRKTAPYTVHAGGPGETDLVAEWRIVDAKWYEIFAKAGLEKSFKILMRLDEATHEVRAVDQAWSVEWRAGIPTMKLEVSGFRGQQTSVEFGAAYGFTEELRPGEIYRYRFATKELKDPLRKIVAECGWGWRGVAFGKL